MICAICGLEVETIVEAIEENWIPYFYEGETEHGPVCASCADQMIHQGEDGKMNLMDEYRGKIQYLDHDYPYQAQNEDLVIEISMTEELKGQRH